MAEEQNDSTEECGPQFPDFGPLLERAQRISHGLPGKKLTALPQAAERRSLPRLKPTAA